MKLLRMKPGHGEIVLAEGDVEIAEEEQALIEAFRRELDAGMWAAVPTKTHDGRREAELVKSFAEVPRDAERVIFFPRAAGGAQGARCEDCGAVREGPATAGPPTGVRTAGETRRTTAP
jgi:antirestriction protein ArdC